MLTLLGILFLNSSCVKTLVVQRKMFDGVNQQCLGHMHELPSNKIVSETVVLDLKACYNLVGYDFEVWATKIGPYLNDLNRRSGKD